MLKGTRYSDGFKKLINDKKRIRSLISGGGNLRADLELYEKKRFFISKAINSDGTILDIGCANGFLVRCLQEWSGYKLEPFGIDIKREHIRQAKQIFPLQSGHFVVKTIDDSASILELSELGLPTQYDFVYWNVWDNWEFRYQREINVLKAALSIVADGGRLILGFYESDINKYDRIERLVRLGFHFSGILKNSYAYNGSEAIVWKDNILSKNKKEFKNYKFPCPVV